MRLTEQIAGLNTSSNTIMCLVYTLDSVSLWLKPYFIFYFLSFFRGENFRKFKCPGWGGGGGGGEGIRE